MPTPIPGTFSSYGQTPPTQIPSIAPLSDLQQRTRPTGNVNSASSAATVAPRASISPKGLDDLNMRRFQRGQAPKVMPKPAQPSPSASPMPKLGSNKYANEYFDSLKRTVSEYKPFNSVEASTKGAPIAAALGGLVGGGIGAARDPGFDGQGQPKSRIKNMLMGALGGAAVGGLGAAAAPSIAQGALSVYGDTDPADAVRKKIDAIKLRLVAPHLRMTDLRDMA